MKANKYEKLDALILASINETPKRFAAIDVGDVVRESAAIAKGAGTIRSRYGVEPWRIVDRRLQALRKSGKIRSTSKGWVLA